MSSLIKPAYCKVVQVQEASGVQDITSLPSAISCVSTANATQHATLKGISTQAITSPIKSSSIYLYNRGMP